MDFQFGFEFSGVRYGWKDKKLYRLPCVIGKRSYSLKEIKPVMVGVTKCYNVQKNKITQNKLKLLTKKVKWTVAIVEENQDCPF